MAPSPRRLPGLDGLRALAVSAVVIFHAEPTRLPGGFLGVDVFFVLSGFLITTLLLPGGSLIDFYVRRFRRLVPPLLTMLVVVAVAAACVWPDTLPALRGDLPAALLYVANWHFVFEHVSYFQASGRPSPLQHLWSLAIEEQFYLVWPLVVLACRGRRRRLGRVAAALAVLSALWMAVLAVHGDVPYGQDSSRLYFGTDTHAQSLLVGAALAAWRPRLSVITSDLLGMLGFLVLGWSILSAGEFSPGLYRGGFLAVSVATAAVVNAVIQRGSRLGTVLDAPPLRWLGTRSYALYLWHWPVDVVTRPGIDVTWPPPVTLIVRLAVPLLLAEATHRLVEHRSRRTRRWMARFAVLPWRPVVLPAILVAVTVVALAPAQAGTPAAAPPELSPPQPVSAPVAVPVPVPVSAVTPAQPVAQSISAPPVGPVLAVGDSVLLGTEPLLEREIHQLTVDAVVGRQARPTFAALAADLKVRRYAGVILVLGNNGVVDPADLDRALRTLRGRRVVLVAPRVPRDWQSANLGVIRAAAKKHPGLVVVDWYSVSRNHRSWFYSDGFHPVGEGVTVYAGLVATALGSAEPLS